MREAPVTTGAEGPGRQDVPTHLTHATARHLRGGQWPVMQAIDNYLSGREPREVRGYVRGPAGVGKTVYYARMLEDLRSHDALPRTLITVPTRFLREETAAKMAKHGFRGRVEAVQGWQHDMGQGDALFVTYHGLVSTLRKPYSISIKPNLYGMTIFDEAHHLLGEGARWAAETKFAHTMQLGFTATPDYDEERRLQQILPDEIHHMTNREAVHHGLIAPFTTMLLMTHTDMSEVRATKSDYDQKALEKALNTDLRNHAIARFFSETLGGRIALFNVSTIAHAEAMAEALRAFGVKAAAAHSKLPRGHAEKYMQAHMAGKITALVQAKMVGEGYDNPRIEVIVNVDPTISQSLAAQRTGRGQRIDEANSSKVMLVVECADYNYRRRPVFFGDERAAGAWSIAPGGFPEDFTDLLGDLDAYRMDGLACTTGTAEIARWYDEFSLEHVQRTVGSAALGASVMDTSKFEAAELPDDLELSAKKRHLNIRTAAPGMIQGRHKAVALEDIKRRWQDPEDEEAMDRVIGFILGKTLELGINISELPSLRPVYAGMRLALRSERYLPDNCSGRLAQVSELVNAAAANRAEHEEELPPPRQHSLKLSACRDSDRKLFFPTRGESTTAAKAICASCVVQEECGEFAVRWVKAQGIWGGLSTKQRRRIRKARGLGRSDEEIASMIRKLRGTPDVEDDDEDETAV